MKKKAENFTAAVFLAVLGICLVLVLTGVVRVGTGQQEPGACPIMIPARRARPTCPW